MKELGFVLWVCGIITGLVIVFHISFIDNLVPLSDCHLAEIQWYYDKPMCIECKLFCEVKK